MSDEHQPAEADNEAAPVASSDSDSAADMKAILVVFTAAVAFACSTFRAGLSISKAGLAAP